MTDDKIRQLKELTARYLSLTSTVLSRYGSVLPDDLADEMNSLRERLTSLIK